MVTYLLHRIHLQLLLFIGAKFPVNLCVFDVRTSHIQYYYTIFYISVLTLTFSPRLKQGALRRNLINKKSNKRNTPLVALFYFFVFVTLTNSCDTMRYSICCYITHNKNRLNPANFQSRATFAYPVMMPVSAADVGTNCT